jgi:hypothetical protein
MRLGIARVDGNAARVAGEKHGAVRVIKAKPRWVAARMEPRGREQHRWANREVEVSGST